MNTALWIVQGFLGAILLLAGTTKSATPAEKLKAKFPWTNYFSLLIIRFIGIAELIIAIGLVVPWFTSIAPFLTPLAATGLCVIMILAAVYHGRKKEYRAIGINMVLLLLAAFVVYGRL